ncbi:MAG: type II secretion system protein [bacterium]
MNTNLKKGFTLVELLIVIAILAILAVAVVLVLNPAQLLKQGRDATRVSDMAAVNNAIALYLTDVASPSLGAAGSYCTASVATTTAPYVSSATCTYTASTAVDGNGWVKVNFGSVSAGSPISKLPVDPANTTNYMYVYGTNGAALGYKLGTVLESTKYAGQMTTDGGTAAGWYEVGNLMSL